MVGTIEKALWFVSVSEVKCSKLMNVGDNSCDFWHSYCRRTLSLLFFVSLNSSIIFLFYKTGFFVHFGGACVKPFFANEHEESLCVQFSLTIPYYSGVI